MAQSIKNLPAVQEIEEIQVQSLGWDDPLEEGGQPTPEFLPGKNGQRSLQSSGLLWQATVHRVAKSLT